MVGDKLIQQQLHLHSYENIMDIKQDLTEFTSSQVYFKEHMNGESLQWVLKQTTEWYL